MKNSLKNSFLTILTRYFMQDYPKMISLSTVQILRNLRRNGEV